MFQIKLGGFVAGFVCTATAYYRLYAVPMIDTHTENMRALEEIESTLLSAQQDTLSVAPSDLKQVADVGGVPSPLVDTSTG